MLHRVDAGPHTVNLMMGQVHMATIQWHPHPDGLDRPGVWRFVRWENQDMLPNHEALGNVVHIMKFLDDTYPMGRP